MALVRTVEGTGWFGVSGQAHHLDIVGTAFNGRSGEHSSAIEKGGEQNA